MRSDLRNRIFNIESENDFAETALEVFKYQADNNPVFGRFINELNFSQRRISAPADLPFLPISFFKSHSILTGDALPKLVFESSGTTGLSASRHFVADPEIYEQSFNQSFRIFYGDPSEYMIAALLPSYLERKNSSLIYMVRNLTEGSTDPASGFYLDNIDEMLSEIYKTRDGRKKVILIGVSYALLDLAEKRSPDLSGVIVMETGGMKGRRKEIIREELHSLLKGSFNLERIHSEYGMTELLSQAWSGGEGLFYCPPWMKVFIRDPQDPLTVTDKPGITGGINIIDLANIYSCSFIATGDLGRLHGDGSFEVLGRTDNSDIRGCNLMIG